MYEGSSPPATDSLRYDDGRNEAIRLNNRAGSNISMPSLRPESNNAKLVYHDDGS